MYLKYLLSVTYYILLVHIMESNIEIKQSRFPILPASCVIIYVNWVRYSDLFIVSLSTNKKIIIFQPVKNNSLSRVLSG